MDFQQRLRQALEVKSVHQVLHRLESVIDGNLGRLEAVKTALDGSGLSVQTETPTPRTREQIAVGDAMRLALRDVQRRKRHPDIRRLKKRRQLAKSRSRFLDSIGVPDEQIDFSTVPLMLPTVNRLPEARQRFLGSLENAKTT